MTKIYLKLVCHSSTYSTSLIPGLKYFESTLAGHTFKIKDNFVNNNWYDLNQYAEKHGYDLNEAQSTNNLQFLYNYDNELSSGETYKLPWAKVNGYKTQSGADSQKDSENIYYDYFLYSSTNSTSGQGVIGKISNNTTYFKLDKNDNTEYYFRIDILNPLGVEHNYPIFKFNDLDSSLFDLVTKDGSSYKGYIQDKTTNIISTVKDSYIGVKYKGETPLNIIRKVEDSEAKQATLSKESPLLTWSSTFAENEILDLKLANPTPVEKTADFTVNSGNFTSVNTIENKYKVSSIVNLDFYANKGYTIDFNNSYINYTTTDGHITKISFSDSNKYIYTRSDLTTAVGLKYSFNVLEGKYDINIVATKVTYTIDYSTVNHTYLSYRNLNTGLKQKLTTINADQEYHVYVESDNNWSFEDCKLLANSKNYLEIGNPTYKLKAISPADYSGNNVVFSATEIDNTPKPIEYANISLLSDNITVSPLKSELNKITTITITADSNYILATDSSSDSLANGFYKYGSNGDEKHNLLISSDHKTATFIVNPTTTDQIFVSCETKIINQPETDRKKIPIKLNLTNCNADITELPENTDEEIHAGNIIKKTITLKANSGYIFDKDVVYYTYSINELIYVKSTQKATNSDTLQLELFAGPFSRYTEDDIKHEPSIFAEAHLKEEPVSEGLDSIHIYHMRNAELNNLSNNIIAYAKQNGESSQLTSYDYTKFINQVYRLPFAIPSDIESETNKVYAGLYDLEMYTHKVIKNYFDVNIGTITVPSDNSTNYNALKATLYLPYINSVDLSIDDIVDNTLKITYRINLLNGVNTLIIENNSGILVNKNTNVSTSLQIFGTYYDKTVNSLNSVLNNKIRTAYLVISRKEPIKNLETYPTNEHGIIKDYNGLCKFANTKLVLDATYQEKEAILSQLEKGVFIK